MRFQHSCPPLTLFVVGLFFSSSAPAGLSDPKDLELIRTLIAHNVAAYDKIKTLRVEQEWSCIDNREYPEIPGASIPGGHRIEKSHGVYIRRGEWFRCDYTCGITLPDTNRHAENRTQAILSDRLFSAVSTSPTPLKLGVPSKAHIDGTPPPPIIRLFELDSIGSMPASQKKLAHGYLPPNPTLYGFEIGGYAIGPSLDYHPNVVTWSVEEKRGENGTEYIVKKFNPYKGTTADTFDSGKDYLVTRRLALDLKGKTLIDITVHPAKFNGVWLAERVDELNPLNNYEFHLAARKIEINGTVADAEFEFDTLEFDPNKAVLNRYARGAAEPVTLVMRDGVWIPIELAES
jgi:hypothetical protein